MTSFKYNEHASMYLSHVNTFIYFECGLFKCLNIKCLPQPEPFAWLYNLDTQDWLPNLFVLCVFFLDGG